MLPPADVREASVTLIAAGEEASIHLTINIIIILQSKYRKILSVLELIPGFFVDQPGLNKSARSLDKALFVFNKNLLGIVTNTSPACN